MLLLTACPRQGIPRYPSLGRPAPGRYSSAVPFLSSLSIYSPYSCTAIPTSKQQPSFRFHTHQLISNARRRLLNLRLAFQACTLMKASREEKKNQHEQN